MVANRNRFQAVFYRALDGTEPVDDYIAAQPVRVQVLLDNQIDRLNDLGPDRPHLPYPHSSHIREALRELRCRIGGDQHRILFARSEQLIVLLHAFRKSSKKIPEEDIAVAQARWEDFKRRMHRVPRQPPRAAGHDAPPKRT